MRIYKISEDVDKYQWICPVEKNETILTLLDFDGTEKADFWKIMEFYVFNPKRKEGNFYSLGGLGAFACDAKAADILSPFLGYGLNCCQ